MMVFSSVCLFVCSNIYICLCTTQIVSFIKKTQFDNQVNFSTNLGFGTLLGYSRVSNKSAGWNKRVGWTIPPNLGHFGDLKLNRMHDKLG